MEVKTRIGLFGFGCVGQGLYDILQKNQHFNSKIVKICVRDKTKNRSIDPSNFTFEPEEILNHPDVNLVVELISDEKKALEIVKKSLAKGQNVITANKKMVAENFAELWKIQQKHQRYLLYEASCCGSIPIIRTLEEYYDNEPLISVEGIINGSSNYILSKVMNEGKDYQVALSEAQEKGFAEADPTLDVEGYDAANKLSIIIAHAFGLIIRPDQIFTFGIGNISQAEREYAVENNFRIKLMAVSHLVDNNRLMAMVIPAFVKEDHEMYHVENEFNAVVVHGQFSDRQTFKGKGAGGHPTGSAVLSDISASTYGYKYELKKLKYQSDYKFDDSAAINCYIRYKSKHFPRSLPLIDFYQLQKSGCFYIAYARIAIGDLIKIRHLLREENAFLSYMGFVHQKMPKPLLLNGDQKLR